MAVVFGHLKGTDIKMRVVTLFALVLLGVNALPEIDPKISKAKGLVDTFGEKLIVEGDGSVDIRNVDIVGRAYISLGISGITVSGIDMDFKVGRTSDEINELLEIILIDIINENL
ncbi:hypothetical protein SFRURICE_021511 [Spodoptera frugiperda]|nr:hypothetical protein SFRURICE_021511 [Spodoptera frugiperda]